MDPKIKNAILSAALVAVSVAVAIGLLEIYARLVAADGSNFDIEMWRYAKDLKRVSDVAAIGHEHIPGKSGVYMKVPVNINSVGWRDHEHPVKKSDGVTRIMMLGDYLTFGWGAPPEDITSHRLENLLNKNGGQVFEVINTGIGNANTAMEVAYFINKGYIYKPDIVALNYFINDAEKTPRRTNNFVTEHFYSAVLVIGRIDVLTRKYFGRDDWRKYYQSLYQDSQPGWAAARDALKELSRYCKDRSIKLIVVHYPELHQLSPYPFQGITDLVSSEAMTLDIQFLDLLPSVADQDPRSLWVTSEDAHPNGKAAEIYAESIAKFIVAVRCGACGRSFGLAFARYLRCAI